MEREINAWKIMYGLFKADEQKSFLGRTWQVVSRFTWEGGQTFLGLGLTLSYNVLGSVQKVHYVYGATVSELKWGLGHMSAGPYINIIEYNPSQMYEQGSILRHEFGHYKQSKKLGPLYMFIMALSFSSASYSNVYDLVTGDFDKAKAMHEGRWYERWATKEGERFFKKRLEETKGE